MAATVHEAVTAWQAMGLTAAGNDQAINDALTDYVLTLKKEIGK
ncbi:MAG: hypothetical protein ACREYF_22880 [Gammaproteobacteria bacterium]